MESGSETEEMKKARAGKEYRHALIKMVLIVLAFTVGILVLFLVIAFSNLGGMSFLLPVLALPLGLGLGLWLMRSGAFKEFRQAAIKNSMYSSYNKEIMKEMNEAMQQGPAKEYMDKFREQVKGELREEMKKEKEQKQQGKK